MASKRADWLVESRKMMSSMDVIRTWCPVFFGQGNRRSEFLEVEGVGADVQSGTERVGWRERGIIRRAPLNFMEMLGEDVNSFMGRLRDSILLQHGARGLEAFLDACKLVEEITESGGVLGQVGLHDILGPVGPVPSGCLLDVLAEGELFLDVTLRSGCLLLMEEVKGRLGDPGLFRLRLVGVEGLGCGLHELGLEGGGVEGSGRRDRGLEGQQGTVG